MFLSVLGKSAFPASADETERVSLTSIALHYLVTTQHKAFMGQTRSTEAFS